MEDDDSELLRKLLLRKKELMERKAKLERLENISYSKPILIYEHSILNEELDSNKCLDKEKSQERSLQDITNASGSSNDIDTNEKRASGITNVKPKSVLIPSSSDSSDVINTSTVCLEMSNSFFHDSSSYEILDKNQVKKCLPIEYNTSHYSDKQVNVKIISNINITELDPIKKNELLSNLGKNKKKNTVESNDIPEKVLFIPQEASTPCKLPTSDLAGGVITEPSPSSFNLIRKSRILSNDILPSKLSVDENTSPFNSTGTLALPPAKCSISSNEFAASEVPDEGSTPLDITGTLDFPAKLSTPDDESVASKLREEPSNPLDITGTLDSPPKCSIPGDEFATSDKPDEDSTPLDITGLLDLPYKYSTPSNEVAAFKLHEEPNTALGIAGTLDLPVQCCYTPGDKFAASERHDVPITLLDMPAAKCTTPDNEIAVNELPNKASAQQKRKRKCKPLKFKMEHIDFLSDEELNFPYVEDFSPGSSDEWSEKESDGCGSTDSTNGRNKKRIKKKKKPKLISEQNKEYKKKKKNNTKKIRKGKRGKGESYETFSGKMKEAKSVQDNQCKLGKCPRACYEIAEDRRQNIFKYFWSLDTQRKRDWLVQCSSRVPIKRKKTDAFESRRKYTFEYYINEGEGRRQVCQQFIIKTLDITQTFLLYTVTNTNEGLSQEDKRNRTAEKVYDEATLNSAKIYIENLPLLPSHYRRKTSNKLYLPQEFKNKTNLFRLYRKWCEEKKEKHLSERLFLNLFQTEYNNISVHVPKKDKCKICAKGENNPDEVNQSSEIIKVHTEEKEATYERFQCHQQLNTIDKSTIVSSFDLQKILNTPHGDNILLFYTRKYTVYNFTVYESSTQNGFCYIWGESDGKRGSKEIGSCLFQYLKNIDDRGIKKVILYCDSCAGQNRNKTILSIFNYFLSISRNVEIIQINYLLPGHSYMPVDSMHSVIEREVRKLTVWSYTQWPTYIESARKNPRPYTVNVLEHKDFIDWDPIVEIVFGLVTKDLQISKIRVATLKKKDLSILKVKNSMKADAASHDIKINKTETKIKEPVRKQRKTEQSGRGKWKGRGKVKGKGRSKCYDVVSTTPATEIGENLSDCEVLKLKPLYAKRLPISNMKYKDLKKLCDDGIIPNRFNADFLNLPFTSNKKDTLMETDEEDSTDVDNKYFECDN